MKGGLIVPRPAAGLLATDSRAALADTTKRDPVWICPIASSIFRLSIRSSAIADRLVSGAYFGPTTRTIRLLKDRSNTRRTSVAMASGRSEGNAGKSIGPWTMALRIPGRYLLWARNIRTLFGAIPDSVGFAVFHASCEGPRSVCQPDGPSAHDTSPNLESNSTTRAMFCGAPAAFATENS